MDRFEEMGIFVELVECKSFTKTGSKLHISPSKVSLCLRRLEERLQVQLINRTTRTVEVTPEGNLFYEHCRYILAAMDAGTHKVRNHSKELSGTLKINVASILTKRFLLPVVSEFLRQNPDVTMEFINSQHLMSLSYQSCDAMVRVGPFEDSSLVALPIATSKCIIAAAPSYLREQGEPSTPEHLNDHNCIQFSEPSSGRIAPWFLQNGQHKIQIRTKGNLLFNEPESAFHAAAMGYGVLYSTEVMLEDHLESGELQRILPQWEGSIHQIVLAYPKKDYPPALLSAFIDFIRSAYEEHPRI